MKIGLYWDVKIGLYWDKVSAFETFWYKDNNIIVEVRKDTIRRKEFQNCLANIISNGTNMFERSAHQSHQAHGHM